MSKVDKKPSTPEGDEGYIKFSPIFISHIENGRFYIQRDITTEMKSGHTEDYGDIHVDKIVVHYTTNSGKGFKGIAEVRELK